MRILDVHPTRGLHSPGHPVELRVVTDAVGGLLRAHISHLACPVATIEQQATAVESSLFWQPPPNAPRGYGVDVVALDGHGAVTDRANTAFDVLIDWTRFPRYGFLSDFAPARSDLDAALGLLALHHVNALQLYDWQFRHDQLVAPTETYDDPLGRTLSRATIRDAIESAHRVGMATMAYMAIYAASTRFWQEHPEWALYDQFGGPLTFEDFLGLMDPSRGSPWSLHLLDRCREAITEMGFDGIHVDQYGEPRLATDATGRAVELPRAFADFITDLKAHVDGAPVTMNAVKNWPIEALTAAPQDFVYIEVWPDTPTYRDLRDIVLSARTAARKPVVIALYLPAEQPDNVLVADSLLLAAGAWRIELGEDARLLTDPYFPNHSPMPPQLAAGLRRFHDLAVRYGELVGPEAHVVDVRVEAPPGIWALARRNGAHLAVTLVNMVAVEDLRWDEPHSAPELQRDVALTVTIAGVSAAWWASPDAPEALSLSLERAGASVRITVPSLHHWGVVTLQTDQEERP